MSSTEPDPSPEEREARRLRAWELHHQGWSQRRIADALGITQGAVSQWLKRAREGGGAEALRHYPAPGRRSALTPAQLEHLPVLLAVGAGAYGYTNDQWTTVRIAAVIKQVFGVSYHPAHVSRILRKHYPEWREK